MEKILLDKESAPNFGLDFPAKKITANMFWEDVVLNLETLKYINEIIRWLEHHHLFFEHENLQRR